MARFSYNLLYPLFERLWRRISPIWRSFASMIRPIIGRAFLAIGWREGRRRQDDPEIGTEGKPPDCEGQYEEESVAGGNEEESVAGGNEEESVAGGSGERTGRETYQVEPRCEESDDDDGVDDDDDDECCERTGRETYRVEPRCKESDDDDDDDDDDGDDHEFDSERYRVETTDEFYCGYDSTWETEENQRNILGSTRRPVSARDYKFSRFERAARDMQNYRHDYPSKHWMRPVSDDKPNLNFYLGKKPSVPDGVYIHDFHNEWAGDYDALEHLHTYIQWLFPLQEQGVNYEASPLTREEVMCFLDSSTAKDNLLKSYKLMLDFYGIELCDEETGEVKRASNWEDRFKNLNTHTHNNLRITRILKCQGTLGYPQYQAPLVRFFLEETLVNGELRNVRDSVLDYFVFAVLDKTQRRSLIKFAYLNYDRKDEFVWCPKKIQEMWSRRSHVEATEGQDESF